MQSGSPVQASITQISRGGCLIYPPLPSRTSTEIRLSFRLAKDLPYINCKGEIIYSINDRGTGVAFREISIFNQDLITDYFEKRRPAEQTAEA